MALRERSVFIPFAGGQADHTDPIGLQAPAFISLVNARQDKTGRILKRPGRTAMSTDVYDSGFNVPSEGLGGSAVTLQRVRQIHQIQGQPLLSDGRYMHVGELNSLPGRVLKPWIPTDVRTAYRYDKFWADGTYNGCDTCELNQGARYRAVAVRIDSTLQASIEDVVSGAKYYSADISVTCSGDFRLIRSGSSFYLFWRDANTLKASYISVLSLGTGWSSPSSLQTDFNDAGLDVCVLGSPGSGGLNLAVVYGNTTSAKLFQVTSTLGAVGSPAKVSLADRASSACNIDVSYDTTNSRIVIAYLNNADTLPYIVGYNTSHTVSWARTQIDAANAPTRITACRNPATGFVYIWYSVYSVTYDNYDCRFAEWDPGSSMTSSAVVWYGYSVASKAVYDTQDCFAWLKRHTQGSFTPNSVWLLTCPFARNLPRAIGQTGRDLFVNGATAGGPQRTAQHQTDSPSSSNLPPYYSFASWADTYYVSSLTNLTTKDKYLLFGGWSRDLLAPTNVGTEYQGVVALAGGLPALCDGRGVYEQTYVHRPTIYSATPGAGGSMSTGTYSFIATYVWYDAVGNRYESAASSPVTVSMGANTKVTLLVQQLVGSTRGEGDQQVQIAVYRTQANGSIYYRDTLTVVGSSGTPNGFVQTIVSTQSDTSIASNPLIYTQGRRVSNDPPPASRAVTVWGRRLWYAEGDTLWPSTIQESGTAPGWSGFLSVGLSDVSATIYGLAAMDAFLLIFSDRGVYWIQGDGVNNTGGGTWMTPEVISGAHACAQPRSILSTPNGVIYQATDGRYRMIGKDLSVQLIGDPIEDQTRTPATTISVAFLTSTPLSSAHDPDNRECHFLVYKEGSYLWLTYNYEYNTWCTNTSDVVPLCVTFLRGPNLLVYGNESPTYPWAAQLTDNTYGQRSWTEYGGAYAMSFRTGWVALQGQSGWQRVRRILLEGRALEASRASLTTAYWADYEPSNRDSQTIAIGTLGLSDGDPLDLRVDPSFQRCKAFSLQVTEIQPDASGTQQFLSFSGLTVLVAGESIQSSRQPSERSK